MSEFIKLTMIEINIYADDIEREILIRPCDIIAVHGDASIAENKCTEVITNMFDCKKTYFVKESVDEILRKIDPLPYTDLENYIFNTPALYKICGTCKHNDCSPDTEPCYSCDYDHDNNWEPKEDQSK